jgi:hypothetical protein
MTNNTLQALREMLFSQLEAITNPDLEGEKLDEEIERTKAVSNISGRIIDSAELELQALKFADTAADFGRSVDVKQITGGGS